MKLGERLRGAARRARARLAKARRNPDTPTWRKRQARKTAMYWNDRLAKFRHQLRVSRRESSLWGGSRAVTNEVVRIVGGRAPVTSRKRPASHPLSRANPGSDHNGANSTADAVDFGIANAYSLAHEIASKLGAAGEWSGDYDSFTVRRNGNSYRVQIIAGTHGTGPHLHIGVRRA